MKERPILMNGAMVRATLAGTKTQTRRIIKPQPEMVTDKRIEPWQGNPAALLALLKQNGRRCPFGQVGDSLYVRETWAEHPDFPGCGRAIYRADPECKYDAERWTPSIHMPRWASRILLEIVSVRVERLNDCSAADARAEGLISYEHFWRDSEYPLPDIAYEPFKGSPTRYSDPVQAYRALWESINGAGSWDSNPWVWVIEFKRVTP